MWKLEIIYEFNELCISKAIGSTFKKKKKKAIGSTVYL